MKTRHKVKWVATILILILSISLFPMSIFAGDAILAEGHFGDGFYWYILDEEYVLFISGTGDMVDFNTVQQAPWAQYKDKINAVYMSYGITHIGDYAFYGLDCINSTVTITQDVKSIGVAAFAQCENMTGIVIPEGVEEIGQAAFYSCKNLETVTIPQSVNIIDVAAFRLCTDLTSVYFEGNAPEYFETSSDVDTYGKSAFESNVTLYYTATATGWVDSESYDSTLGTWNGYKLKLWEGSGEEKGDDNDEGEVEGGDKGEDEDYGIACHLEELTDIDYLAFADLSYSAPAPSKEIRVKEMLKAKWEHKWGDAPNQDITYKELYSHIYNWRFYKYKENTATGFAAYAFKNDNNEVVIAYRGSSNPFSFSVDAWNDWVENDLPMIFADTSTGSNQIQDAIQFYNEIAQNSDKVATTGHSLGGALGDIVSAYSGCYGETFNAISALDVAYIAFPEDMMKNFNGVDTFNFIDHVNEKDTFAGMYAKELKNYKKHESLYDTLGELVMFNNHKLDSFVTKDSNGNIIMTETLEEFNHSSVLMRSTRLLKALLSLLDSDTIGGTWT